MWSYPAYRGYRCSDDLEEFFKSQLLELVPEPLQALTIHSPILYPAAPLRRNKPSENAYTELFYGNLHAEVVKKGKR